MERLDNILKSVATSSSVVSVASVDESVSVTKTVKEEEVKTVKTRNSSGHNDDERKQQRRDRNRQAAARCRKRRMDLTSALQVSYSLLITFYQLFSAHDARLQTFKPALYYNLS